MFKYFDINDRGSVDFNDFIKAMEKIGLYYSGEQLQPLFKVYDSDRSGSIDYKEFSSIVFGSDNQKAQMTKKPPANRQEYNN
jgi:Ca2+-binding EF-hand superfamily protein